MVRVKKVFLLVVLVAIFTLDGCVKSNEDKVGYNKSAAEWYNDIQYSIAGNNLEKADKQYISLRSEHRGTNLLPTAMLMLALALMNNEEYLLSNFYLDEYLARFPGGSRGEYARYLKLKAAFLSIGDINKDQKRIVTTLSEAKKFYSIHRGSRYAPLVQTMIARLEMSLYLLNREVASLYGRVGKPKAAEMYIKKNTTYIYKDGDIDKSNVGLLSRINPL